MAPQCSGDVNAKSWEPRFPRLHALPSRFVQTLPGATPFYDLPRTQLLVPFRSIDPGAYQHFSIDRPAIARRTARLRHALRPTPIIANLRELANESPVEWARRFPRVAPPRAPATNPDIIPSSSMG